MRKILFWALTLALVGALLYSAVWYSPDRSSIPAPDDATATRIQDAADSYARSDGTVGTKLKLALGSDDDHPVTDLDMTNVVASISDPTLRKQGSLLILSVTVTSITNNSPEEVTFSDVCSSLSASHDGHRITASPVAFVNTFNSIPGNEWFDGGWLQSAHWALSNEDDSSSHVTGGPANKSLYAYVDPSYILKTADCFAGSSEASKVGLGTDFPSRTVPAGETMFYTGQNVINFVIPPAPAFVFQTTSLADSAYPFIFGGVYLVSEDYKYAAYIPLS